MGATPYILHENCIKNKKYYFKARVQGTSGKNSSWSPWVGKIAGDTVMPTVIEASHISAVSNPQQQVSYYINDTYTTPGDFEVFRWYAVRRAAWVSPYTWQASYANNYYEGTRNHTYTLKAERQYPQVWDIFVGVMDVAGNLNIPNTPQLVGVVPTTQVHVQDYSHDIEMSSIDADTVGWAAGTLMLGNNERYNIAANNTGDMSQDTYVYLDTAISVTELQTTVTASGATGPTKKLVAVAKNSANEAIFQTFGGIGGMKIRAQHIEAYSISGNNISAATTITAGTGNNVGVLDGADALWRIYAGHATPASAPFRVDQAGQMYATGATIEGSITANTGVIGGWTVGEAKLTSSGGGIALDAHDNSIWITNEAYGAQGIQLEDNSGTPRAYIGDGSNKYFQFDGTDVSWKGINTELTAAGQLSVSNILATGGTVGGWTLAASSITGGASMHIKAGQTDFSTGTGFYLGHDGSDYKFSIGSAAKSLEWDGVNLTIDGMIITGIQSGSEPSIQGWSHNITFSATDDEIVEWTGGGAVAITLTNGDSYSIVAGNTGVMSAVNYIYLDKNTSSTVLQVTTTAATAVGSGKILLAVAENNSGSDATFQTFGGEGGAIWTTQNLAADTVTANEIAANTITAAEIFADTITANEIAANAITAVEIAASTILASNIRAGTISGMNIAANARIVAGTGDNVAVLDGDDAAWRIYAGHDQPSFAPFKVRQDGAAWLTQATIQTASGSNQRIEISSIDNTMRWYNDSNEQVILMDDNIYASTPGIQMNSGVIYLQDTGCDVGFIDSARGAAGTDMHIFLDEYTGVTGELRFQSTTDSPVHFMDTVPLILDHSLTVSGTTTFEGLPTAKNNFNITGIAGQDPTLLMKSYSTAESDRPTITFEHERDGGGTSTNTIAMHEYALKINCDEEFFLTANANKTMYVSGANDVTFYEDVTISGATQLGGRGAAVDCITVTDEGVLTMNGAARVMKPVSLEPDTVKLPGANAPAADDIDGFPFHRYDRSTEESVKIHWEIPHGYFAAGTIHVHYEFVVDATTGAGDEAVVFGVEYKKISPGDVFDFSSGTSSQTITETIGEFDTAWINRVSGSMSLTTTGFVVGDVILLRFYRDATAGADTFDTAGNPADNDVWIFNYHLEYEVDQHGGPV